jgi:ring-1,2-phenylacetyl-CoA epoxidase subunit PaaE
MLHFHSLQLASRTPIAADAFELTFDVPTELQEAYSFAAGQHLAVRAQVGGKQLRRTYSIVTPPGGLLSIGVRVQGAMSRYLAEQLQVGESLDVMTPNGHFTTALDPDAARSYVAFAAGSGITPVLSLASAVLESEPKSRFRLFYCNRDIEHAMFLPEVLALKDSHLTRFVVHFVMSREPQDAELFNGRLDGAKVKELAARVFDPQAVDEYFLCGPGTMVDDLQRTLADLGVTARVHVERFAAAPRGAAAEPRTPVAASPVTATGAVEVVVQMDGRRRSFSMPTNGPTVLEAGEAAGLELPFSCRDGICATCRAKVVEGAVTMTRNQGLEPWEIDAGFVLCCQARPTTPRLHLSYDEK